MRIMSDFAKLLQAYERFDKVLDATTDAAPDAGRRVMGRVEAFALSEATNALHNKLAAAEVQLIELHGVACSAGAAQAQCGIKLVESDTPGGLGITPIPADAVTASVMTIGGVGGAPALLWAAIQRAMEATAFPLDMWNKMQAENPGADHQRWHEGDVLPYAMLQTIARVGRLLRVAVPKPAGDGDGDGERRRTDDPGDKRSITFACIRDELPVSNGTLNKYAKLAKVPTPRRGKQNHLFTPAERRAILVKITERGTRTLRENARAALQRLDKQIAN
jgi:hypothetical protein